ncbi:gamma-glutamyltransferase family protein [Fonticella tunisiensis]|uniref:Gamma-glutamyltranspeptidase/glutathione hydrolase n=1 Tax=Fonticella tunisiensis TaxID=1096341 RepID=A0A4R7KKY4_9CLOT|nr:gamma-glutamyltransferase family protein [Fonticella tunisiensis]TDT56520.1 gamma-glutamyltranspeptidase/glutathione hydrolase [Fonticella tunisiensis]
MNFDVTSYPYPSRRNVMYAKKGMVATSHPLAAQAGLDILKKGGNAIDAAIAAAACLTVVEPTSNGIGGDAFAIVWVNNKLYGLNSSGPAPKGISIERLKKDGYDEIPKFGWVPVTVPGIPAAWAELSKKFGRLPLTEVLSPAIEYAENGYPVSVGCAKLWEKAAVNVYGQFKNMEEFKYWFKTFAPYGRTLGVGEVWKSKDHARTLGMIAETNGEAFYKGEIAERIDRFSRETGGYIRKEDLEGYKPEWVEPISVNYRGYDVWELPPNGQGLVALLALNILRGFEFNSKDTVDTYHKQLEAIKLAFADGQKYITDPLKMKVKIEDLLSEEYGERRRKLIGERAEMPCHGEPDKGGTVYLAAADGEGNMVSYIQSNYMGFGSGVVIPETGIALQNRGYNFSLDPEHDNCLEPGKRTYHTIIPGFLTKDNKAVGPFGVMGGFMQPQGHVQVIMNTIDFKLNPQSALDAPRWQWIKGKTVEMERGIPQHIAQALADLGHDIRYSVGFTQFGRGQIIWRNDDGVLVGGTEPRTDGTLAIW